MTYSLKRSLSKEPKTSSEILCTIVSGNAERAPFGSGKLLRENYISGKLLA
jgi:hypothetical protein